MWHALKTWKASVMLMVPTIATWPRGATGANNTQKHSQGQGHEEV